MLEKEVVPKFEREAEVEVSLVYLPAGQQYNRLRMSGEGSEADLFLHASPLYLEKGAAEGRVDPVDLGPAAATRPEFMAKALPEGGRAWHAFAWTPLVVVRPAGAPEADLATSDVPFGFPHPLLSNNGVYAVLFFEEADPEAGARALAHTRVQPTNARANIGGVAEGSFQATLGYEAVVRFYQEQGAKVDYAIPLLDGERVTTPALFSASLIHSERHPKAEALLAALFTNETQDALARYHFRSVHADDAGGDGLLDLRGAKVLHYDWGRHEELEEALTRYEVAS